MNIIDINYLTVVVAVGLFLITAAWAVINSFCNQDSKKASQRQAAATARKQSFDKIHTYVDRMLKDGRYVEAYEHVVDMKRRAREERNLEAVALYRKYEHQIARLLTDSCILRINAV